MSIPQMPDTCDTCSDEMILWGAVRWSGSEWEHTKDPRAGHHPMTRPKRATEDVEPLRGRPLVDIASIGPSHLDLNEIPTTSPLAIHLTNLAKQGRLSSEWHVMTVAFYPAKALFVDDLRVYKAEKFYRNFQPKPMPKTLWGCILLWWRNR